MTGFREPLLRHAGVGAPLLMDNVDTDQIIPSREMKAVSRHGLGEALFAGWRYLEPGGRAANPDFVLNRKGYEGASVLIAGKNFGCGSSREHAVWALKEFGVRAIIASSFGAIFHANCARNGILPITADEDVVKALAAHAAQAPQEHLIHIDLPQQTVTVDGDPGLGFTFDADPYQKRLLTEGLDPIGLTLTQKDDIDRFLSDDRRRRPWIYA